MTPLSCWIANALVLPIILIIGASGDSSLEQLCSTVLLAVTKCGVENVVLLTDFHGGLFNLHTPMINALAKRKIVFIHYAIDNNTSVDDITKIIQRHTLDQHIYHTTFLVITSRFDDVIQSANHYSKQNPFSQRGQLWFHSTRWMFIANCLRDIENFITNNNHIPMDNIAFITLDKNLSFELDAKSKTSLSISFYSLLWKLNRTRKLERVVNNETSNRTAVSYSCVIFPNIRNNMNGRHLKVITKTHWGFFVYIDNNPLTGVPEYRGFLPDVLNTLALTLNFTYTVLPYPTLDNQPTWDEVAHNITSGEVDFSATVWSYSWVDVYNICVTYPVLLDTFTGVYRRPIPSEEYMSMYILCPFHSFTYVLLFASLVHTFVIYVLIVEVCYSSVSSTSPRNPFNVERRKSKFPWRKPSNPVRPRKKKSDSYMDRLRQVAWSLAASVLNQAYLPRPVQMSARLLLFLWSIAMVIFSAIYTGSLTAEMINSSEYNIVGTFEDLVDGNSYNWGTTHDSIIDKVMKNKSDNGIFYKLNKHKQNIPDGENGDVYMTLRDKIDILENGFVLIHFRILLNQIIGMMDQPDDYIIMKDSLLSANQGFIVSKQSELGFLFSDKFRKMHESGVIEHMYQKYAHGNRTVSPRSLLDAETRRKTLTLENIRWPLIIISLLVLLSVIVLIVEKLWHPISKSRDLIQGPK